jgi:multiple sugar transport system ATP-binding protein
MDNALDATVVAVERLGSESLLHARLSTKELVTWRVIGSDSSSPGDAVILGIEAARCHLFNGAGAAYTRLEASS